jgi:alpha-1,6-mannosyltransferase
LIKTLHLTNAYHSESGGIRTFYQAMLAAATDQRRYLRLVVPADRTSIEEVSRYARIYHVRAPRSLFIDRRYRLILPHRFLFGARGPIWKILRAENPDLIEVCDKYALCYLGGLIRRGWLTRAPRPALVGLTCERMDDNVRAFLSGWRSSARLAAWYMRTVYVPQFDSHIAVSGYTAEEVAIGLRPVHTAPMGLDVRQFSPRLRSPAARADLFGAEATGSRTVVLLYVGRLSAEKNLPLLLDVIANLGSADHRSYHLWMFGEGPLRERLAQEGQRRAPGRVHLPGHVGSRDALARIYANADVFLHPNPREPLGLAPLEAMASGLALVAPDSGGVREYATAENAWLARASPEAFARAVRAVLACPERTAGKVARAHATAAAHDWTLVTGRYFALYEEIGRQSEPIRHI